MKNRWFFLFLFVLQGVSLSAQDYENDILMNNPAIQIEATEAVNRMYNYEFQQAEKEFMWIKSDYPEHPIAYFLLGLSNWWKILPDVENESYDEVFLAYMDTAISKAEAMGGKKYINAEKVFFLAGAWAFKGRLYAERESYRKASTAGRKALNYLQESREYLEWSPEFLFGEGLYNYYREWIPENYKYLKPVMLFFPKGDKELGTEQLEENAKISFYTRTEAQYWLMRIYDEEGDYKNSRRMSTYLFKTFPGNPYFHRYYTRMQFVTGNYYEAEIQSRKILENINKGMQGYEAISGRYASFFLGFIMQSKGQSDLAKMYYQKAVKFAESNNSEESGYYLWSLTYLARMAKEDNDSDKAVELYKKVKENSSKKSELHKEAKKYLKKNDPYRGFLFF